MVMEFWSRGHAQAARIPAPLWSVLKAGAGAALIVIAVRQMPSLQHTIGELGHPSLILLLSAIAAQLLSLLAYTLTVSRLLARSGVRVGQRPLLRMTVGGIAMSASLPAGAAASVVYWYRQLLREGANASAAASAIFWSMIAGIATLGGLLVAGVAIAGDHGPLAGARVPIFAATAATLLATLLAGSHPRGGLARLTRRFAPPIAVGGAAPLQRTVIEVTALAVANWLLDLATLYLSLRAVDADVPLTGLLLVYALSQVVQSLPLLPGGGGTVEASLSLGIAAFGHTTGSVIAGVLLYRLISTWGLVPLGWTAIALDSRHKFINKMPRPKHIHASRAHARA
jgi:hypothetical protein